MLRKKTKSSTEKKRKLRRTKDEKLAIALNVASFLMDQKNKNYSLTKEEKKLRSAIYKQIDISAIVKEDAKRKMRMERT